MMVLGGAAGCTAETEEAPERVEAAASVPDDAVVAVDEILALDEAELDARFAEGRAPTPGEMPAELRGVVLTEDDLSADDLVVVGVRSVLDAGHYAPWLGKRFTGPGTGENLVVPFDRELRTVSFTYGVGPSRFDGEPALQLDYARHDNLFLLWGVKEELRVVGRGVYLGRSYFETGGGRTPLFYFVLSRP